MDRPTFEFPSAHLLAGQLTESISSSLGESATSTHPTTIPTLSVEIGQNGRYDEYGQHTKDQHGCTNKATIQQCFDIPVIEQIIIEWPHILQIIEGNGSVGCVVQSAHDLGDQEGKPQLEEHDRYSAYHLVLVVSVFQDELVSKGQNSHGIECSVHEPLASSLSFQQVAKRVEKCHYTSIGFSIAAQSKVLWVEIQDDVEGSEQYTCSPSPKPPTRHRLCPNVVVLDALRMMSVQCPSVDNDPCR